MARGQPDFGLYTETPVASGISDPGEAAARLGSINVYDRRGWTVWMDNFEAPKLTWDVFSAGGGIDPILVTTDSWMGTQSVYFSAPAAAAPYTYMRKLLPLVRAGKIGMEFWIRGKTLTPGNFLFSIYIYDGTNESRAQLEIDLQANTLRINTLAGWVSIDTGSFPWILPSPFTPVKLVVDTDTDYYTRIMVGANEYDISAHQLLYIGLTGQKYLIAFPYLAGDAIGDMYVWFDNFILTQNEP